MSEVQDLKRYVSPNSAYFNCQNFIGMAQADSNDDRDSLCLALHAKTRGAVHIDSTYSISSDPSPSQSSSCRLLLTPAGSFNLPSLHPQAPSYNAMPWQMSFLIRT